MLNFFLPQLATVKDFYITEANKELEMIKTKMNSEDFHAVQSTLYGCFLNILAGYAGDAIEKCSAKYFGSANELPGGDLILPTTILDVFKKERERFGALSLMSSRVSGWLRMGSQHILKLNNN